ncbi:SMC family ATPase [Cocleimonas sp. KMM 6892]|uniref:SMC family ATPase n=1 Tax=unclassified Cocleimonas TaxID=2639732 RepID=UPI002DB69751|nr:MULTISPECIES: SMC family ATPase [unclassified Cocleimonas]MEB8433875.1 SMC family ATPase [Cocleimonas sp. KMM 6892]MEC4716686.1 SMC family ATPase [Cocleimonas sp. KMM 6895]MEC4746159.1 SMC family ATPase [Cocleimonas sp. KMM 6896]
MKPIKLSMTAFGPFINTEVIDFEALGENPLFLINGTTGSGKTTILDAICFALYGQTTGKEREAMQMRCDFAPDDLLTEVEFVFELGGELYQIKRVPEQERAKAKGEGTTKQAASAELNRLDKDRKIAQNLVARKVSDATQMIEQLTGLQVDQFRQVMVLPQGQFRQLLMADSKDREKIFSQLFETHVYKRIEDKLRAQASVVAKKVQGLKDQQEGVFQNVGVENLEALELIINQIKPEVKTLKAELAVKNTAYLESVKAFEKAKDLEKDFQNLKQQEERFEALKQQESEIKQKQEQLSLAAVAEKITPVFSDLSKAKNAYEESSTQLTAIEERHQTAVTKLKSAEEDLLKNPQRQIELDKKKEQLIHLKSYQEKGEVLNKESVKLKTIQDNFVAVEKQFTEAQAALNKLLENQETTDKEKAALEAQLSNEATLKLRLQTLSDQIKKRQNYEALETKIVTLTQELTELTQNGKRLKASLEAEDIKAKSLELKWHQAQAAILAKDLQDDQACPVCGSFEHPQPAYSEEDLPTDHDRELAQSAVTVAREKHAKAQEAFLSLRSSLNGFKEQLAELQKQWNDIASISLDELNKEHQALTQQLALQENQQKQLTELKEKIDQLKTQIENARKNQDQLQAQKSELNGQLEASKALVANAEKALPEEYRDLTSLNAEIQRVNENIEALNNSIAQAQQLQAAASNEKTEAETNLKNQQQAQQKLKSELEKAQSAWQSALEKSDFENEAAYQQARLDEAALAVIKKTIEEYTQELQKVSGIIENQQAALKGKVKPDMTLLATQLQSLDDAKNQIEQQSKEKDKELGNFEQAQKTLNEISKSQQAEEDEYKIIGTLSNVANGNTGNKISLQRFVLSVLLDDVLIDASHRLKLMSKGRYNLLRKEDRAKGNKASGLELEVEDSYTGKIRPVSTLSGGESFMASLSLALGLSDVVQAYAGGIHLDTLFIDEGFGSLDADSLDLAIRTLMDLRDTGRMVGIISHVSELKEQIPVRIDVKSRMEGSYIELVN